jgi:hypothetical protein
MSLSPHQAVIGPSRTPAQRLRDHQPPFRITGVEPSSASTVNRVHGGHDGDAGRGAIEVGFARRVQSISHVGPADRAETLDGPCDGRTDILLFLHHLRIIALLGRRRLGRLKVSNHQGQAPIGEPVGHDPKLFGFARVQLARHARQFTRRGEEFHRDLKRGTSICVHGFSSVLNFAKTGVLRGLDFSVGSRSANFSRRSVNSLHLLCSLRRVSP